jgi:4-hydroxy-3-polyprenylbenzoate decarboxylase
MRTLTLAGAVVCPAAPGFYLNPTRIEDLVDFMAGKVLDLLGVEHDLKTRWEESGAFERGADESDAPTRG